MFYDILNDTYLAIGHGGKTQMLKEIQKKIQKYLISYEMNSKAQIDLINIQSQVDNDFKIIFVYQDHLTNFVQHVH